MIIVCGGRDLGACPPENFEKLNPLRLNLHEGTFNGLLPLLFQDSMHIAKQLMYILSNSTKSIARGSGGMPHQKNLKN